LNRPGSNITGVTLFIDILTAKRVELLTEVAPNSVAPNYVLNLIQTPVAPTINATTAKSTILRM
jgi:hypothetical protein